MATQEQESRALGVMAPALAEQWKTKQRLLARELRWRLTHYSLILVFLGSAVTLGITHYIESGSFMLAIPVLVALPLVHHSLKNLQRAQEAVANSHGPAA